MLSDRVVRGVDAEVMTNGLIVAEFKDSQNCGRHLA